MLEDISFNTKLWILLFYLLLQLIKLLRAEKLAQCHIQTITQFLHQIHRDFLAARVKHTITFGYQARKSRVFQLEHFFIGNLDECFFHFTCTQSLYQDAFTQIDREYH